MNFYFPRDSKRHAPVNLDHVKTILQPDFKIQFWFGVNGSQSAFATWAYPTEEARDQELQEVFHHIKFLGASPSEAA